MIKSGSTTIPKKVKGVITSQNRLNGVSNRLLRLRNRHFLLLDALIVLSTPSLAFMLRLDTFVVPSKQQSGLVAFTLASAAIYLTTFYLFGLYSRYWIYASIDDMFRVLEAVLAATTVLFLMALFFTSVTITGFPRSIPLINGLLVLILVSGNRAVLRFSHSRRHSPSKQNKRVLVFGAGDAGTMIVREMQSKPQLGLIPVAFLDDDPLKCNMQMLGLRVLGGRQELSEIVISEKIDRVIIAIPTAPGKVIREVASACDFLQVDKKIVPDMSEILDGRVLVLPKSKTICFGV